MSNRYLFEKSSFLSHCDYDEKEGCLEVGMQSGKSYRYKCDKSEYDALKAAKSPGGHFASIRSKYKHLT